MQPRFVRADRRILVGIAELRIEEGAERTLRVGSQRGREPIKTEAPVLLFLNESRVLQQAKMARHAGLGEAKDASQLGDVEALAPEDPQQAQPRLVAKEAVQGRSLFHIYQ